MAIILQRHLAVSCRTVYRRNIYIWIMHNKSKLTMYAEYTMCVGKLYARQWRPTCIAKSNSLCMHIDEVPGKAQCNTVVLAWQPNAKRQRPARIANFTTLSIGFSVVVQGWWWVIARTHALALSESSRRSDRSRDRSASVFRNSSRCIGIQPKPIIAYM